MNCDFLRLDGRPQLTLEAVVNRIVFGIPNPPRRFDHLDLSSKLLRPQRLVKVCLSEVPDDAVYFKNESHFDVTYSELANICVLLCKLPSENVNQLFKRLLFNTCTILQSDDIVTVDKCIQGIMQLFYPLNCGITCIPNLPENKLEYISQCSQSVIGVVRERSVKTGPAKRAKACEEDKYGTSLTLEEVQRRAEDRLGGNHGGKGGASRARSQRAPAS